LSALVLFLPLFYDNMNVLCPTLSDALRDKLAFHVTFYSVQFLYLLSSPVSNSKRVSYYWSSTIGTSNDHATCVLLFDLSCVFSLSLVVSHVYSLILPFHISAVFYSFFLVPNTDIIIIINIQGWAIWPVPSPELQLHQSCAFSGASELCRVSSGWITSPSLSEFGGS
jgi:hypothetical protein